MKCKYCQTELLTLRNGYCDPCWKNRCRFCDKPTVILNRHQVFKGESEIRSDYCDYHLCRFCNKPNICLNPQQAEFDKELEIRSLYCKYHHWCAENGDYDDYY